MKYTINWGEIKTIPSGKELFEGEFVNNLGNKFEATIWRMDKDNKEFPGWSELRAGGEVEANPWTKPGTNKVTLYPPTPEKTRGGAPGAFKAAQIEKVMDKKNESIANFQDKKEESIALMAAQRDAVLIVTKIINESWGDDAVIKEKILKWRNWFLSADFKNTPPF